MKKEWQAAGWGLVLFLTGVVLLCLVTFLGHSRWWAPAIVLGTPVVIGSLTRVHLRGFAPEDRLVTALIFGIVVVTVNLILDSLMWVSICWWNFPSVPGAEWPLIWISALIAYAEMLLVSWMVGARQ